VSMSGLAIANVVALIAGTGWLAKLTMLPSNQTVRVRNAFLLRRSRLEDFAWTPSTAPPDFRVENHRAPAVIEEAVTAAKVKQAGGDWQQSLALVTMLLRYRRFDGAIQSDLAGTYDGIVAGAGYCADYVRVYLAAASSIGIFCRQWAFSFDGFGGHGHTFVEVYDRQHSKWIFLDVHNNVCAVRTGTDELLGALELRDALLDSTPFEFKQAGPGRLGFRHFDKLLDYYQRGANQWYLWWGNDVIARGSTGLTGALSRISGRLAHRLTSAFHLPPLVAVVTNANEREIAKMERLRRQVTSALLLIAVLVVLFGLQLGWGAR
jgi:hypothetical protein